MDVSSIVSQVRNAIELALRPAANIIPSIIMICGLVRKPGLSCILSTSKIIENLGAAGIPTGPNEDGSANLTCQLVHSVVCEVFRALREDANIQVAIPPGSLNIVGGTNVTPNSAPIFGQIQ